MLFLREIWRKKCEKSRLDNFYVFLFSIIVTKVLVFRITNFFGDEMTVTDINL